MDRLTLSKQIIFLLSLLIYKVLSPIETIKGKRVIFLSEILWTLRPFTKVRPDLEIKSNYSYIQTRHGKFYVNPDLQSLITVSPSFERLDMDYLKKIVGGLLKKNKKVLFVDVGAHIGLYSVALGNEFKKNKKFSIVAFEPNASNFHENNFSLLKKNVELNKITNIKLHKKGLGSEKSVKPNKFGVITQRMDSIIPSKTIKSFDSIVIKIDIEGYETDALIGSRGVIENAHEVYLMAEDCIDKKLNSYLLKNNFHLITKLTPYNSFWERNNVKI